MIKITLLSRFHHCVTAVHLYGRVHAAVCEILLIVCAQRAKTARGAAVPVLDDAVRAAPWHGGQGNEPAHRQPERAAAAAPPGGYGSPAKFMRFSQPADDGMMAMMEGDDGLME